jgi:hypothetical protein
MPSSVHFLEIEQTNDQPIIAAIPQHLLDIFEIALRMHNCHYNEISMKAAFKALQAIGGVGAGCYTLNTPNAAENVSAGDLAMVKLDQLTRCLGIGVQMDPIGIKLVV